MTKKAEVVPMSQKNARKERNAQEKAERKALIKDLQAQLKAMRDARETKMELDFEYLHGNLLRVCEQYKGVEGYMDALTTFESLIYGERVEGHDNAAKELCTSIARFVATTVGDLAAKIKSIGADDLDRSVLDGLLTKDFISTDFSNADITRELLISNLLRNVEPLIEKLVEFRTESTVQIEQVEKALAEYENDDK